MTAEEYLKCIKRLNPGAMVVVWERNGRLEPTWDASHTGIKPSYDECLAVLPTIQSETQTIIDAELVRNAAKAKAILDNLPSLSEVLAKIDTLDSLAKVRGFLKQFATVVYMDITGKID